MLLAFCQMLCAGTTLPRPHGLFLVLNYNLLSHYHVSFLLLRRYLGMDEPSSHCSLATFMHAKVFLFHPVQYICRSASSNVNLLSSNRRDLTRPKFNTPVSSDLLHMQGHSDGTRPKQSVTVSSSWRWPQYNSIRKRCALKVTNPRYVQIQHRGSCLISYIHAVGA